MPRKKPYHVYSFIITSLTFKSQKLYKNKFKEWNWQKNLSADTALKMAEKAKRRKREEGKDTVFSFGGRVWDSQRIENTLVRAKKSKVIIDLTGEFPYKSRLSLFCTQLWGRI